MMKSINFFSILFLFFLCGCSKKEIIEEKRYPVKIGEVIQGDIPHYIRAIGELNASLEMDIRAQVSGILTGVLFTDGAPVEEGDLLMTIDQRPFQADLKAAEANLAENKAKLNYALDFAKTYGSLVGKEYVARLDYAQGIQNVDIFQAEIEKSLAAIEKANISLGYTEIRAPIRGYVGQRAFDVGNYVDAMRNNTLVTIRKVIPITVSFSVPSEYLQRIRNRNKQSPLYIESYLVNDRKPLKGILDFIDNTVNDATGMIKLQGTIANEDERGWPGQFVRVNLLLETLYNAISIPTSAIVLGQDGYHVFVVKDNSTVDLRPIEKGIEYEDYTVIVKGLQPKEKVVIDGQLNLYPGAKVYQPNQAKES